MFAAAATNYVKPMKGEKWVQKQAYHLINVSGNNTLAPSFAKARFNSSSHRNYRPESIAMFNTTFEKSLPCDAETPIGQATVCSDISYKLNSQCRQPPASSCHQVYAGHNALGNELHWLPNEYLRQWWTTALSNLENINTTLSWDEIPNGRQCRFDERLWRYNNVSSDKLICRAKAARKVDSFVREMFLSASKEVKGVERTVPSWSPLYASLPVLRVTVIREPFSWLASKYSWHRLPKKWGLSHDNITEMTFRSEYGFEMLLMGIMGPGWVNHFALDFIIKLCGEDCLVRYIHGTATLEDIDRQAEDNLRNAFAVVGIQHDMDTFFGMVSVRIAYNMENVTKNAHLKNEYGSHPSLPTAAKDTYNDPNFQRQLLDASPELASLNRLYKVALEVNRYQLDELRSCPLESR